MNFNLYKIQLKLTIIKLLFNIYIKCSNSRKYKIPSQDTQGTNGYDFIIRFVPSQESDQDMLQVQGNRNHIPGIIM